MCRTTVSSRVRINKTAETEHYHTLECDEYALCEIKHKILTLFTIPGVQTQCQFYAKNDYSSLNKVVTS